MLLTEFIEACTRELSSKGDFPVTADGGFDEVTDIAYCVECKEFHIESIEKHLKAFKT